MKTNEGQHCIDAQLCRADFYFQMSRAIEIAGGSNSPSIIEKYQNMKLCDVVDILAQNGIRMLYIPECNITYKPTTKPQIQ